MKNKMKTKKALLKRIKITGTGKWLFKHAYTSHLALNKSTKQKRQLRKSSVVNSRNQAQLKWGLPYLIHSKKNNKTQSEFITPKKGRKIFVLENKPIEEPKNSNIAMAKELDIKKTADKKVATTKAASKSKNVDKKSEVKTKGKE